MTFTEEMFRSSIAESAERTKREIAAGNADYARWWARSTARQALQMKQVPVDYDVRDEKCRN